VLPITWKVSLFSLWMASACVLVINSLCKDVASVLSLDADVGYHCVPSSVMPPVPEKGCELSTFALLLTYVVGAVPLFVSPEFLTSYIRLLVSGPKLGVCWASHWHAPLWSLPLCFFTAGTPS